MVALRDVHAAELDCRAITEWRKGTWIDPDAGRVPLREYAEPWIEERPALSRRTVRLYGGLLRNHIGPKLDGVDLVDLTRAHPLVA